MKQNYWSEQQEENLVEKCLTRGFYSIGINVYLYTTSNENQSFKNFFATKSYSFCNLIVL